MAINNQYSQLGALPTYNAVAPASALSAIQPFSIKHNDGYYASGGVNAMTLGAAADSQRQAAAQRDADRNNAILSGYDQQISNSRMLADQGYQNFSDNYAGVTADAAATRDRNMTRINQYGDSMRSDLDIRNKQALAAASQSAIKRGLGNTTISDSLQRGQAFDNTRQKLSLEDQLLQNQISTDASLSQAYQNTLQNRATGLASQWNQNMANENGLTGNRLNYLAGIKQEAPTFSDISNIYQQDLQMQNSNQQAALNRAADNPTALTYDPYTGRPSNGSSNMVLGMPTRALSGATNFGFNFGR